MKGKEKKRHWLRRTLLGLIVSAALLAWILQTTELEKVKIEILSANISLLFFAVLATVLSYLVRAFRWGFFFRQNPPVFWDSFRCLIVGFFMNNTLPLRLGEFVRAHLGGKATKQSRAYVLATIAGERLADGLMISALFAVLFTLGASNEELENGRELFYVALGFAIIAVSTALLLYKRHLAFALLNKIGDIFPGHLSTYTLVRIKRVIEGLEPMLQPKRFVILAFWSLIVWSIELSVYYFVAKAFNQPLSLGSLSLFLAAVNFASLIPAAPGGIGVIEGLATVALVHIGIAREVAFAMVVTQHLIQILVVGLPGVYFFVVHMHGRIPEEDEDVLEEDELEQIEASKKFTDVSATKASASIDSAAADAEQSVPFSLKDEQQEQEVDLSIVIPAYNEEERLPKTLLSILEYLDSRELVAEVIVVDDGSEDGTPKVVRQFERLSPRVKLLLCSRNRGKGFAVKLGIMNSVGKFVLFNDADGASPIEELGRLEEAISAGAQIAIGSRAMFSSETAVETLVIRKLIGRVFNGLVNFIILPGIADTQCGFKLFEHRVAHDVFSRQRSEQFSFDVEILYLARRAGYKIAEVPINWTNVPGSKVNLIKDSFNMLRDIIIIRLRDAFGGYEK